jgi:hypothetical protein
MCSLGLLSLRRLKVWSRKCPLIRHLDLMDLMDFSLKGAGILFSKEFINLAHEFHAGRAKLENMNDSYITLIPKQQTPRGVGDFRPISLTSVGLEFLKKWLRTGFRGRF